MDPSDPKFQLLVGMMSGERPNGMQPREPRAGWGCIVVVAVALVAACLLFAARLTQ